MAGLDRSSRNTSDPRTKVTCAIWGFATGLFALCIPLAAITRGGAIIPAAVALGAGAGTVAVWRNSDRRSNNSIEAESHMRSLEERIANLETIASSAELNAQHPLKRLELLDGRK
ncbi:MAG: hypothetical protein LDL41_03240 [Coleofasciculus sp. S288]|nr:hypothetical protein [Coleofasciculus sp. S288]